MRRALAPSAYRRNPSSQARSAEYTVPAPVRGWVLSENLVAADPRGALVLENWYPTVTGVRVRKGASRQATVTGAVVSMFNFSGAVDRMFAATASTISNVTAPSSATVAETPVVRGLSGGAWSVAQMAVVGGERAVCVNGADWAMIYDGLDFVPLNDAAVNVVSYDGLTLNFAVGEIATCGAATATILAIAPITATTGKLYLGAITSGPFADNVAITTATGAAVANGASASASSVTVTGVSTKLFVHVTKHKNRLWFVEKDSSRAWYLPAGQIGGAAVSLNLGAVFQRGGDLYTMGTWSSDSGDGLDDRLVFVSANGEAVVYQGTDPANATTWAVVGRYDIGGIPLGRKATSEVAGDFLIATTSGLVPMTAVVAKDPTSLDAVMVSRPIEPEWRREAAVRQAVPWEIARSSNGGWTLVISPISTSGQFAQQFVVNSSTGAWALWRGWDAVCATEFAGNVYFGTSAGTVLRAENGGSDDGAIYQCRLAGAPTHLNMLARYKEVHAARATFIATIPFNASVTIGRDYQPSFGAQPGVKPVSAANAWGSAVFGTAVWGGTRSEMVQTQWQMIEGNGRVVVPQVQITLGSTVTPEIEMQSIDFLYDVGGSVV